MTVETNRFLCGCAGKTPLDRVVRPARERMRRRLRGTGVALAGDLEAGLLPRTETLDRETAALDLDGPTTDAGRPESARLLPLVLADRVMGSDPDRFAEMVGDAYRRLVADSGTVVKGHSVQVPGADGGALWCELLEPRGGRSTGHLAANVDLIHAFPDLDPAPTARIATRHALNDCYAYGATEDRTVRPVVAVPEGTDLDPETVGGWYRDGGSGVEYLPPAVVRHDGDGWLFGATATAGFRHRPPVRSAAVEPDDCVLLHRPLGGPALYASAVDRGREGPARERALRALSTDHAAVARTVARFSPGVDEPFDPSRHLKLAADVSGPGVAGLSTDLPDGLALRVDRLPFLDPETVRRVRDEWLVPDVTVGTNGPIAMVGSAEVVAEAVTALERDRNADPRRVGRVVETEAPLTWAPDVELERYVERAARFAGHAD